LIKTLFEDISLIAMGFIRNNIVAMIKNRQLDIQKDRWCFASDADAEFFYNAIIKYYEDIIDFALSHRLVVRILIFESLKNGKHHNDLFQMLDLINNKDENSFYQLIWNADQDFSYSPDNVVFKFFFGFLPLFNFAAYFDDYMASSGLDEAGIRKSFLLAYKNMVSIFFRGKDIIL